MPKGLFIGLGGAGVKTVARLKALLFQGAYGSDKEALDADCSFIFYDTDEESRNYVQRDVHLQKMMGRYPVIDPHEYVDAGSVNPCHMFNSVLQSTEHDDRSRRMLEWATDPSVQGLPDRHLAYGAGARRMMGRFAFFGAREELEERIREGIQNDCEPIWVFSSCCGGTGSSAVLDVLYLVDRLDREITGFSRPSVRLVMFMPKSYIEHAPHQEVFYHNSYATLWELNEFRVDYELKGDGKKFGAFAALPDEPGWEDLGPWNVCKYVMAIDTESQRGNVIGLDEMYANTAELCYQMYNSTVGELLENDFYYGPEVGHPRESQNDPFKWSRFVLGAGFRSIVKADDFLKDYLRVRFRYDLYGYGLQGVQFETVWPDPADRKEVAGRFADDYIFKHLVNIRNHELSSKESLYGCYMKAFDSIQTPFDMDIPSKGKWEDVSDSFVMECKKKARDLSDAFTFPSGGSLSISSWLRRIQKSVKEGVEKSILEYGLNYTYALIEWTNKYLRESDDAEFRGSYLKTLEKEIRDIVKEGISFKHVFQRKKYRALLANGMEEYRRATAMSLAMDHIRVILEDITRSDNGLLDRIREGGGCMGILNIINEFSMLFSIEGECPYKELASVFKKTKGDACFDYFPHVYDFVDEGGDWRSGHVFELLYNRVIPKDMNSKTPALSDIIDRIKHRLPEGESFFSDLILGDFRKVFPRRVQAFKHAVDQFIEDEIIGDLQIQSWLHEPLESAFIQSFFNEDEMRNYLRDFLSLNRCPVFYPCSEESLFYHQVEPRFLLCGDGDWFVREMGYAYNANMQYENRPGQHRFTLIRFEVGHDFYDYKYFPMLKDSYERAVDMIKSQGSGCHIHKYFVIRDLEKAYRILSAQLSSDPEF